MADINNFDDTPIRIPLIGAEYSRTISTASGASTSSGIIGIGVIGVMVIGRTVASTRDQRFINFIPEKITNSLTKNEKYFLTKRPGFAVLNTPAAANKVG